MISFFGARRFFLLRLCQLMSPAPGFFFPDRRTVCIRNILFERDAPAFFYMPFFQFSLMLLYRFLVDLSLHPPVDYPSAVLTSLSGRRLSPPATSLRLPFFFPPFFARPRSLDLFLR